MDEVKMGLDRYDGLIAQINEKDRRILELEKKIAEIKIENTKIYDYLINQINREEIWTIRQLTDKVSDDLEDDYYFRSLIRKFEDVGFRNREFIVSQIKEMIEVQEEELKG